MSYIFILTLTIAMFFIGHRASAHSNQMLMPFVCNNPTLAVQMVIEKEFIPKPANLELVNTDFVYNNLLNTFSSKPKEDKDTLTKDLDEIPIHVICKSTHISCILPLAETLPAPENIYLAYDALLYSQLPPP